jgi:hypothetical protein
LPDSMSSDTFSTAAFEPYRRVRPSMRNIVASSSKGGSHPSRQHDGARLGPENRPSQRCAGCAALLPHPKGGRSGSRPWRSGLWPRQCSASFRRLCAPSPDRPRVTLAFALSQFFRVGPRSRTVDYRQPRVTGLGFLSKSGADVVTRA